MSYKKFCPTFFGGEKTLVLPVHTFLPSIDDPQAPLLPILERSQEVEGPIGIMSGGNYHYALTQLFPPECRYTRGGSF